MHQSMHLLMCNNDSDFAQYPMNFTNYQKRCWLKFNIFWIEHVMNRGVLQLHSETQFLLPLMRSEQFRIKDKDYLLLIGFLNRLVQRFSSNILTNIRQFFLKFKSTYVIIYNISKVVSSLMPLNNHRMFKQFKLMSADWFP